MFLEHVGIEAFMNRAAELEDERTTSAPLLGMSCCMYFLILE